MFGAFFEPRFMPCDECGASVHREEAGEHVCEQERWLAYQLFQERVQIERFDEDLGAYLSSPQGRFELWYAERERMR